ncbi:MAG: ribosome-associated translation inhibitor RaiA [Lentisphaeria bacterium]|nr:ribosome-associated translation inhibitor RaiA [Lentisphaeria bacterium]
MELLLTGKHVEIKDDARAVAQKLADKLSADYAKLSTLRMVLSAERGLNSCEALLNGNNVNLSASAKADSIPAAIAAVYDKLDKQMRRYLNKIQDRSVSGDPALKEKIWASADLKLENDAEAEIFE